MTAARRHHAPGTNGRSGTAPSAPFGPGPSHAAHPIPSLPSVQTCPEGPDPATAPTGRHGAGSARPAPPVRTGAVHAMAGPGWSGTHNSRYLPRAAPGDATTAAAQPQREPSCAPLPRHRRASIASLPPRVHPALSTAILSEGGAGARPDATRGVLALLAPRAAASGTALMARASRAYHLFLPRSGLARAAVRSRRWGVAPPGQMRRGARAS